MPSLSLFQESSWPSPSPWEGAKEKLSALRYQPQVVSVQNWQEQGWGWQLSL